LAFLLSDELRLLYALALNTAVFAAAYRLARRGGGDRVDWAADAFALSYLVQYLAVCLPGLVGMLHPLSMSAVALACAAVLWHGRCPGQPMPDVPAPPSRLQRLLLVGAFLFVVGYCLGVVWIQRTAPIRDNDALAYHAPFAVHWLRSGWLGLHQAWFYNPANVYSPLAGSTFIAWLMAPLGNDVLARFVAVPALIFLFFAFTRLARLLGLATGPAAVLAAAVVMCRPFVQQTVLAKDDLFLSAFFAAAASALHPASLRQSPGPWRLGIALGMFIATKTTALMSLPLLLLAADAPFRAGWRWRQWAIAAGCAALLAGPWYVRNAVLTGNPLYPTDVRIGGITLFQGQFTVTRSLELRSLEGIWRTFTLAPDRGGYYTLPVSFVCLLAIGWVAAVALHRGRLLKDPLRRLCAIGPLVGIGLFIATSPYALIRFVYPSLLLLFACGAMALSCRRLPPVAGAVIAAAALAWACASSMPNVAAWVTVPLAMATALAWAAARRLITRAVGLALLGLGCTILAGAIYVYWPAHILNCRFMAAGGVDRRSGALVGGFWQLNFGHIADGWRYVRNELPPGSVIAYANTFHVYPLYGFDYTLYPVYAPTRPGVQRLSDLPRFSAPTTGEEIPGRIVAVTTADPDRDTWLANLRSLGAQYLFVGKRDLARPSQVADVPELRFAASMPDRFRVVYENQDVVVFRIVDLLPSP